MTTALRVLGWPVLAIAGGVVLYWAFWRLTGMEMSLVGIPVGLGIGQAMYYASGKRGGRGFQILAVLLAFAAFDLTYAPGMASTFLKGRINVVNWGLFLFMTAVSPLIDAQNGFLNEFMLLAGMYLAWTLARPRKPA